MKKILIFTFLIALGFAGGSIMPKVWATSGEKDCNCGCGSGQTQVSVIPSASDMMVMTSLMEALSKDQDGSLSKQEVAAMLEQLQSRYAAVLAAAAIPPGTEKVTGTKQSTFTSNYYEYLNRYIQNSTGTPQKQNNTSNTSEITSKSITSKVIPGPVVQPPSTTETPNTALKPRTAATTSQPVEKKKKVKNNNGLGNGSEPGDGNTSDVKGVDPSNPGKGKQRPKKTNTVTKSTEASYTDKSKKEKVKNNNGLGNGSEPADNTSTDIKGEDPSNPGKGSSNNKAGKK
ncbi:hypothetical protein [Neobacillus terrae]|uniref:hypothetical protein n=1 Tax=Neobacillus terrae TaxID=3034837 RepID=UPI00140D1363|nr:hypothetical protein [Neobacillus terrae]NHM31572.1 hypothetical protein [Neobacillus terrae]